ncbi:MAG: hypothetical protein AAFP76_12015 [Bacteroidota bacterium]
MEKKIEKSDLILKVNVISSMLVGYGDVYMCDVKATEKGVMEDQQVRIVVLPQDKGRFDLLSSEKQGVLEIGFVKKQVDEPYAIMPINGFVDSDKTSWEIVFVKHLGAN